MVMPVLTVVVPVVLAKVLSAAMVSDVPRTIVAPALVTFSLNTIVLVKVWFEVPGVYVPPALTVKPALKFPVHPVAPPRVPPLFTVTAPLKVQTLRLVVHVPVMDVRFVTVRAREVPDTVSDVSKVPAVMVSVAHVRLNPVPVKNLNVHDALFTMILLNVLAVCVPSYSNCEPARVNITVLLVVVMVTVPI
jgi:hypothetical protein